MNSTDTYRIRIQASLAPAATALVNHIADAHGYEHLRATPATFGYCDLCRLLWQNLDVDCATRGLETYDDVLSVAHIAGESLYHDTYSPNP